MQTSFDFNEDFADDVLNQLNICQLQRSRRKLNGFSRRRVYAYETDLTVYLDSLSNDGCLGLTSLSINAPSHTGELVLVMTITLGGLNLLDGPGTTILCELATKFHPLHPLKRVAEDWLTYEERGSWSSLIVPASSLLAQRSRWRGKNEVPQGLRLDSLQLLIFCKFAVGRLFTREQQLPSVMRVLPASGEYHYICK